MNGAREIDQQVCLSRRSRAAWIRITRQSRRGDRGRERIGKWALGIYLGSSTAASVYGAASSLITLLLCVYYSLQILLFGAEFTQVYANGSGARIKPDKYAVCVEGQRW